ncbi:MAG: hypothetical protein O7B26_02715, partial [Planctomycetota bacterium]|nr:hypothetical protein [Planctomycetota bacterium]
MSIHSTVGLVVLVCSMGGGFQGPTGNATSRESDTGACCLCDDQCEILTETACIEQGGLYQGDDTECPPPGCTRYRLHNHPDGGAAPPPYGLRLDGLLTGDQLDDVTFDFDDPQSAMVLDVCDDGTLHIFGQAVLNQPPNGVWQVDFSYTNVNPVG